MSELPEEAVRQQVEAALVRGLRHGSAEAQGRFYRQFAPLIQQFVLARFPDDIPLAEDLMMQTLVEGLLNINYFNPRKASLATWLYGIARRHVQGELRQRYRRKSVPVARQLPLEVLGELAGESDLATGAAARIDDQHQFIKIAEAVSEGELEVLLLFYVERLTAKEISQVIGRSESAVYSILQRARQKARERLADDEL